MEYAAQLSTVSFTSAEIAPNRGVAGSQSFDIAISITLCKPLVGRLR